MTHTAICTSYCIPHKLGYNSPILESDDQLRKSDVTFGGRWREREKGVDWLRSSIRDPFKAREHNCNLKPAGKVFCLIIYSQDFCLYFSNNRPHIISCKRFFSNWLEEDSLRDTKCFSCFFLFNVSYYLFYHSYKNLEFKTFC